MIYWPFNWDYIRPIKLYPKPSNRPGDNWMAGMLSPLTLKGMGCDPESFVLVWRNMKFVGNEFINTPADRTTIEITAS